uniref:Succinate:cytochrome c oxidoreductase subunit 3 n=2 Tax=Roya TaxID=43942 RepID=A0A6G9IFX0_9VIRI|nr:succinate:cytochrome c oxidoreductase subunit 3 [Roya obtusa]YP_009755722.1 succinate:cytochrome c oxidoreductase subunit 3 [Roya anglica]AGZ90396.1 succinate:cytochrome c oxidoreductase subunit 3 [Roya obtusa]QIQ22961.1 succinate:cytochrome c oxidoreductase subunit 3 [Roya anglica]
MKLNRPLSPHLTIYKPQITSTLSIFHRISGAFLAFTLIGIVFSLKIIDLTLSYYLIYSYIFFFINSFFSLWILIIFFNFTLLALSYHLSNGIRHLFWDFGFFLDLSKVKSSGIIMICFTIFFVFFFNRF